MKTPFACVHGAPSATSVAQSSAVVAAGFETASWCLCRQRYLATPVATATETACAAHDAAMSPRLLRVVCCPPPHVFLGLKTLEQRTEFDLMPAAASCVASSGNTDWYVRCDASRALASIGRCNEKTWLSCAVGRAGPAAFSGATGTRALSSPPSPPFPPPPLPPLLVRESWYERRPGVGFAHSVGGSRASRRRPRFSRSAATALAVAHAAASAAADGGGERAARLAREVLATKTSSSGSSAESAMNECACSVATTMCVCVPTPPHPPVFSGLPALGAQGATRAHAHSTGRVSFAGLARARRGGGGDYDG